MILVVASKMKSARTTPTAAQLHHHFDRVYTLYVDMRITDVGRLERILLHFPPASRLSCFYRSKLDDYLLGAR